MPLQSGRKLGPYEIVAAAGAGGMGEVYRARDTRLDRTVAVKVLPEQFSQNPDLKQRFEREARAISSLNHPNICHLYDVGHQDGTDYLVMEYIEGESLASRLMRGPLPLEQTLKTGIEIADALDKAHRQGIVHRDLKPGNVMLTKSGAKLLDFGLAKPAGVMRAASGSNQVAVTATSPPTPITQQGHIVGTFQYMAPEQVEGKEADARSDIFALGAVLYEMATGKRAFEGKSSISIASAILEKDPEPISKSQPLTPPAFDHVVATCLAKDPDARWQSAADLRSELLWVGEAGGVAVGMATLAGRRSRLWWIWLVAGVMLGAVLASVAMLWRMGRTTPQAMYFASPFPFTASNLVLAPDGKTLALVAYVEQENRYAIYLYEIGKSSAASVPGTAGASHPFWSPNGRSLGFFADGKLKRVDLPNGSPQVLADAPHGRGGAWSPQGLILFSPDVADGLYKIDAGGGTAARVTRPDIAQGHTGHRWPLFLPDGRHFLFLAANFGGAFEKNRIMVGSLDSSETRSIVAASSNVAYAQGYLFYLRDHALVAQRFDANTCQLSGEPHPLADQIQYFPETDLAMFATSGDGPVIFETGERGDRSQLVWLDRGGKQVGTLGQSGLIANPSISPNGRRVAFEAIDASGRNADVWIQDLTSDAATRLTFGPGLNEMPIWSADGKRIVHSANRMMKYDVAIKNSDGSGPDQVLGGEADSPQGIWDWSRDGKYLLLWRSDQLWYMSVQNAQPKPLFPADKSVRHARFSPDGRWITYSSSRNGTPEVYVSSFPDTASTWQVSRNGGQEPRWSRDGKELFYLTPDGKLTAVSVRTGNSFEAGATSTLFVLRPRQPRSALDLDSYDVTADGKRFIVNTKLDEPNAAPLSVILNWSAQLR